MDVGRYVCLYVGMYVGRQVCRCIGMYVGRYAYVSLYVCGWGGDMGGRGTGSFT